MEILTQDTLIEWDPAWGLGIPMIDGQHQKLVGMIRELQEDMRQPGTDSQTLLFILFETLDYAVTHFTDEEALFGNTGWPGESKHIREHEAFLLKCRTLLETFRMDDTTTRATTLNWLFGWLREHILHSDRAFADYLLSLEPPAAT